jgi:GlpG protein
MPPLTVTLVISCIAISLLTNFGNKTSPVWQAVYNKMTFIDTAALVADKPAAYNISRGEIWRIFTPIFLHGHPFHLLFNVMALWQLGKLCERMEGTVRFGLWVLLIAAASSLLQGLMPHGPNTPIPVMFQGNPYFVGISGVVFGLFGFLWTKTQARPDLGIRLNELSIIIMLVILVAGFLGAFESLRTANLCHLGGLLSGMALGWVTANWRGPFERNR